MTVERVVTVWPDAVDGDDLVVHSGVEPEAVEQLLRGLQREVILLFDQPPDEVGQAAVGEGDVTGPFENDDAGVSVEAAEACRRRHPSRDATDDHHAHGQLRVFRSLPSGSRDGADQDGVALAAATAQRGRAGAAAAAGELEGEVQGDAVAGHAERVAHGDGAAVDVDDVHRDAEVIGRRDADRGERLVDLEQVDVGDGQRRHGRARP